jgi:hypothetical protein
MPSEVGLSGRLNLNKRENSGFQYYFSLVQLGEKKSHFGDSSFYQSIFRKHLTAPDSC